MRIIYKRITNVSHFIHQLAPYSSVSDDPTEEKQDASHLQGEWEHSLEFDDDFQLSSYGPRSVVSSERNKSVSKGERF